ncbi:MAG: non-ribosomal peptide synthetase, partial [Nostocales cyanobacterium]
LEFLGRIDQQIKLRGFRIELGEIEGVLLQHPLVKEAVVVLHKTTNDNQSLIAYVTGSSQNLSTTLKNDLKSRLPEYMIPAQIIVLEKFPLTPNGKIDRKILPAPDLEDFGLYIAPRNELEQQLANLWSEVLEIETIGIHDNFFNLGGHSLLAIKLLNILEKKFPYNLSLSSLFQNHTIAKFAANISYQSEHLHPDLLTLKSQGNAQTIFCFPGANGSGFYFQDLAVNLENHPVYSLETPGRDGKQTIPSSVENHANQLIELFNYQQTQNSYILVGYSSGSAVAFETAYQLEKQGKKVDLLVILDAGLVSRPQFLIDRKEIDWIWQLIQRTEALKGVDLGLKYADLADQPDDQSRWNLAAEYFYKHNVLPEYSSLDLLKINIQVMKKLTENYANYQPNYQIYAPIILFRAQENHDIVLQEIRAISDYDLPDWGWQAYTQNSVKIISVPGNHGRMLYEPNVKILTTQLQMMI